MEDIRFYDFEFNLLHIESKIISSNWTIKYNGIGSFEAYFPIKSKALKVVLETPYVIAVQGDKQAIITGKQALDRGIIYGKTVNWILSRRVTPDFSTYELDIKKDSASICQWVVTNAFSDMPDFVVDTSVTFDNTANFWRNTYNSTSDVVIDCLDRDSAGHKVTYDIPNKYWFFEIYQGKVLDLVISEDNNNAYDTEYIEDLQNYFNGGYYEKISETTDPDTGEITQTSEWKKINSDKEGIYKWETVLKNSSYQNEATTELKNKKWSKTTKCKVKNLKYMTDYNLGDIVKIHKSTGDWETLEQRRITGINLCYENNNIGEQPIFEEV